MSLTSPSPVPALRCSRFLPRLLAALLVALGLASVGGWAQTESSPPPPPAWSWPERAENLQQLPADLPADRLRTVMTGFSRSLGVRCSHCHVGEEGQPLSTYDFASDAPANKRTARAMLELVSSVRKQLEAMGLPGQDRVTVWCHTCHQGKARPETLEESLTLALRDGGLEAMVQRYRDLREKHYGRTAYDFGERTLNGLGYRLLAAEQPEAAIAIFRLNVEQFPTSSNAYDSLAEAYQKTAHPELAEIFYRKSLELEPENQHALTELSKILSEMRSGR